MPPRQKATTAAHFSLSPSANNAILLNGTSQYGVVGPYLELVSLVGQSFTIETWFYEDPANPAYSPHVNIRSGGVVYAGMQNDNSNVNEQQVLYSGTLAFDGNTNAQFGTNAWVHRAFVYDAATRTTAGYINGVFVTPNFSQPGGGTNPTFDLANMYIGYDLGSFFKGRFACTRLWNVKRSSLEISSNMNKYLDPLQESGLIGNWNFIEGTGIIVANTALNTRKIDLIGTPTWTTGPTLTVKDYGNPRTRAVNRTKIT